VTGSRDVWRVARWEDVRARLPYAPDGAIHLPPRAWATRAVVA
jgi:hypothetical protein